MSAKYTHLSYVPQCDCLGYESETFGVFSAIEGDTLYSFPGLVLVDVRNELGQILETRVAQAEDPDEPRRDATLALGVADMTGWDMCSEWGWLERVADFLMGSDALCEVS